MNAPIWHTETRKLSDLKLWDKNPRTLTTDAYDKLKERITQRGFHDILKIDENNVVLFGNQRLRVLLEIEPKYCDVIIKRWENLTNQKAVKVN